MSGKTKIEWCDRVWNPVTGCSKVSRGCENCYAERLARRFWGDREFTDVRCHPERLGQPMRWRKPQIVFANSMSDLFHPDVPDEFITRVFAIMSAANQHTFVILTKRPARLSQWHNATKVESICADGVDQVSRSEDIGRWRASMVDPNDRIYPEEDHSIEFPLPYVWFGVSVEDQKTAEERIPELMKVKSSNLFLSVEPLLDSIDLTQINHAGIIEFASGGKLPFKRKINSLTGKWDDGWDSGVEHKLRGVICGGESGPGSRPMRLDWARSIRDQCAAAAVPFFFKQWHKKPYRELDGRTHDDLPWEVKK